MGRLSGPAVPTWPVVLYSTMIMTWDVFLCFFHVQYLQTPRSYRHRIFALLCFNHFEGEKDCIYCVVLAFCRYSQSWIWYIVRIRAIFFVQFWYCSRHTVSLWILKVTTRLSGTSQAWQAYLVRRDFWRNSAHFKISAHSRWHIQGRPKSFSTVPNILSAILIKRRDRRITDWSLWFVCFLKLDHRMVMKWRFKL